MVATYNFGSVYMYLISIKGIKGDINLGYRMATS